MRGVLLLFPLLVQIAAAQQPAVVEDRDHEIIRQLLERVQQLEAEVKELKAQRETAKEPAHTPAAAVSGKSQPPETSSQGQPMSGMTQMPSTEFAKMQFRGFSDVSYHATDQAGETNSFGLGQFNLFITSRLSDRLSFLAEAVMEADTRNSFGIDMERLLLQYAESDYLNVSVGRYHTAIGWYNTAYHHSTWMQTAVGRPFLFEFEDKGGILPIHNVGISASGRIPSGQLGLRYVAEIGNGRSARTPFLDDLAQSEPVQNIRDENNGKAVNFAVMARPDRLQGFQAGLSIYHDNVTPKDLPNIGETIIAAHAVYQSSAFEWLNEALVIRNSIGGTGRVLHTPGFYSQISQKFGLVRPYFRYQYLNVPESDPMFRDVGLLYGPSLGLRYDFSEFAAFKIQYDRMDRRRREGFNGVTTQLSFTF